MGWRFLALVALMAVVFVEAGCQNSKPCACSAATRPAAEVRRLSGQVTFEGVVPKARPIQIPGFLPKPMKPLLEERVIVSSGLGLKNVVVSVSNPPPTAKADLEPLTIQMRDCRFEPHIMVARVGQKIEIVNGDPYLHNPHVLSEVNEPFGLSQKLLTTFTPKLREYARVKCDVHPWMSMWLAVFDHPFFALTDEEGRWEIPDLPDGEYIISAWHETLGEYTEKVTVRNGKGEVRFVFQMPAGVR